MTTLQDTGRPHHHELGVVLGTLVGRVGGLLLAFLIPTLDLAFTQSPMVHPAPSPWARLLPGYGGSRLLYDAALTPTVHDTAALLAALAWPVALALTAALIFHRTTARPRPAAP